MTYMHSNVSTFHPIFFFALPQKTLSPKDLLMATCLLRVTWLPDLHVLCDFSDTFHALFLGNLLILDGLADLVHALLGFCQLY